MEQQRPPAVFGNANDSADRCNMTSASSPANSHSRETFSFDFSRGANGNGLDRWHVSGLSRIC